MKVLTNKQYDNILKNHKEEIKKIESKNKEEIEKIESKNSELVSRNLGLNSQLSHSTCEVYRIQGDIKLLNLQKGFVDFLCHKFNINKEKEYHDYMLNDVIGLKKILNKARK